jgi:predicted phage baseplate assembly protein
MFGAGTAEQAYTLETDAADRLWVRFGDGVRGARAPSGQNNLVATYRKGLGAAGNVRGDTLTQLSSRPLGLKGVANPKAALGGTEPETEATARRSMPMTTRTLGRVVSLLDYEDFARAYAGLAKAQATVLALRGGRTIVVTVAAENGAAIDSTSPVWANLLDALQAAGDPLVKVQLLAARLSTMQVGLKVLCDPAYDPDSVLAGVEAALRAAFAFDARELAQPVQQSEVIATAQAVPGVLAVDLDLLYGGTAPVAQTLPSLQGRLLASRARVDASGQPREAELLTLDPGPLAALGVMT